MKRFLIILSSSLLLVLIFSQAGWAQCSICAKSVAQMGTKPAEGFNSGIIYLMMVPYVAIGVISYRWWKSSNR